MDSKTKGVAGMAHALGTTWLGWGRGNQQIILELDKPSLGGEKSESKEDAVVYFW